jgi:hypothetical protein
MGLIHKRKKTLNGFKSLKGRGRGMGLIKLRDKKENF